MQTLHRARDQAVRERTSLMNQLRAVLLERGVIVPQGRAKLRLRVTELLRHGTGELSSRIQLLIEDMLTRWQGLDERIAVFDAEFTAEAKRDEAARRLTSIPGIGALNATALVAAVGDAETSRGLAAGGGPASVTATTRSATSGLSGGMRDGRVLSRQSPAAPWPRNRSCQRQITILALPVACMILAVPHPSAARRMIFARQMCFFGLFRFATTAYS